VCPSPCEADAADAADAAVELSLELAAFAASLAFAAVRACALVAVDGASAACAPPACVAAAVASAPAGTLSRRREPRSLEPSCFWPSAVAVRAQCSASALSNGGAPGGSQAPGGLAPPVPLGEEVDGGGAMAVIAFM
jgi:hypothetical protein